MLPVVSRAEARRLEGVITAESLVRAERPRARAAGER